MEEDGNKHPSRRSKLLLLAGIAALSAEALGAVGEIDTGFGEQGSLPRENLVALDRFGKIWVSRYVCITPGESGGCSRLESRIYRYTSEGRPDTALPTEIYFVPAISPLDLIANDTGGVTILGFDPVSYTSRIARHLQDLQLDPMFGSSGTTAIPTVYPLSIKARPDGSLLWRSHNDWGQITRSGSVDTAFGQAGVVASDPSAEVAEAIMQPDGRTLDLQFVFEPGPGSWWQVRQFDLMGRLENLGARSDFPSDRGHSQPLLDGGVLILTDEGAITRIRSNGQRDDAFGTGGTVLLPTGIPVSALELPDGKTLILATNGWEDCTVGRNHAIRTWNYGSSGYICLGLYRLNHDGSLDSGGVPDTTPADLFGNGGFLALPLTTWIWTGSQAVSVVRPLLAYDAVGRLLIAGGRKEDVSANGVSETTIMALQMEPMDTTLDPITFLPAENVAPGSEQHSEFVAVGGLGEGIEVVATAAGGEIAKNGSTQYQSWWLVKNGDEIGVRHTAASTQGATIETRVRVGGVADPRYPGEAAGAVEAVFRSTTQAPPPAQSGGGAFDWVALALFAIFGGIRARRSFR